MNKLRALVLLLITLFAISCFASPTPTLGFPNVVNNFLTESMSGGVFSADGAATSYTLSPSTAPVDFPLGTLFSISATFSGDSFQSGNFSIDGGSYLAGTLTGFGSNAGAFWFYGTVGSPAGPFHDGQSVIVEFDDPFDSLPDALSGNADLTGAVPEPATLSLLIGGLGSILIRRRLQQLR